MIKTRRSIVQMLGLAPVAGPMAAKSFAESAATAAAGLSGHIPGVGVGADLMSADDYDSPMDRSKKKRAFYQHIISQGLPDFIHEEIIEKSKSVHQIEFDIASKRSWSLAAKIHEQRKRNRQRYYDDLKKSHEFLSKRDIWEKLTGLSAFWRPW